MKRIDTNIESIKIEETTDMFSTDVDSINVTMLKTFKELSNYLNTNKYLDNFKYEDIHTTGFTKEGIGLLFNGTNVLEYTTVSIFYKTDNYLNTIYKDEFENFKNKTDMEKFIKYETLDMIKKHIRMMNIDELLE